MRQNCEKFCEFRESEINFMFFSRVAMLAMEDAAKYLEEGGGEVAVSFF